MRTGNQLLMTLPNDPSAAFVLMTALTRSMRTRRHHETADAPQTLLLRYRFRAISWLHGSADDRPQGLISTKPLMRSLGTVSRRHHAPDDDDVGGPHVDGRERTAAGAQGNHTTLFCCGDLSCDGLLQGPFHVQKPSREPLLQWRRWKNSVISA